MSFLKGNFSLKLKPPELDHFIDAAFFGLTAIIFTFNYPLGLTPVYLAFFALFVGLNIVKVLFRIRLDGVVNISLVTIWYAAFTVFALSSVWWAAYPSRVTDSVMRLIQIILVLFAMSQTYGTPQGVRRCLKIISLASFFTAAYILTATPFSRWFIGGLGGSVTGQNTNFIGMVLTVGSLVTAYFAYYEGKRFYYIMFACQAMCTVLTSSRKSALTLLCGFVLLVFLKDRSIKLLVRILVIAAAVCLIVYVILEVPAFYSAIGRRFESMALDILGRDEDGSMTNRALFRQFARQLFAESPLIGNGLGNFQALAAERIGLSAYSHSNYYEILSGLGIVGFSLYYWLYSYIYIKLIKPVFKDQNSMAKIIFTIMLAVSVCEYGIVIYYSMYTPIFLGAAFLFVSAYSKNPSYYHTPPVRVSA